MSGLAGHSFSVMLKLLRVGHHRRGNSELHPAPAFYGVRHGCANNAAGCCVPDARWAESLPAHPLTQRHVEVEEGRGKEWSWGWTAKLGALDPLVNSTAQAHQGWPGDLSGYLGDTNTLWA